MEAIKHLLEFMNEKQASDLLLTVGRPPELRLLGSLVTTDFDVMTEKGLLDVVSSVLNDEQKNKLEINRDIDLSFGIEHLCRFRINIFYQRGSHAIAIRRIPHEIPTMEELGLPGIIKEFAIRPNGLIFISGPVGSGKSTTLATMIEHVNKHKRKHIVCIEDPIEYLHKHKESIIEQRELGSDAQSFTSALKSVFRQSPDVIMVGEMRDLDSIRLALTLAETGHLVLSTLHTQDATHAINRILDAFPAEQQSQVRMQLSLVLVGVVVQMLIPKKDGSGLALACEIMNVNNAVRSMIRENQPQQIYSALQTGKVHGMLTMNDSLELLLKEGQISEEEALSITSRPKELRKKIQLARI